MQSANYSLCAPSFGRLPYTLEQIARPLTKVARRQGRAREKLLISRVGGNRGCLVKIAFVQICTKQW